MRPQEVLGGLLHGVHIQAVCLQCPAPVPLKHGQVVMPVAASDQTVQVGPGCGRMAGMEVPRYSESLQYPYGVIPFSDVTI